MKDMALEQVRIISLSAPLQRSMPDAARAVLKAGFDVFELEEIVAFTVPANLQSRETSGRICAMKSSMWPLLYNVMIAVANQSSLFERVVALCSSSSAYRSLYTP